MAWMHMQIAAGLVRLGHEVSYVEVASNWPYEPVRKRYVDDSDYALPYLERLLRDFGMQDRWAYRRSYSDYMWLGPLRDQAEELLLHADAVINVSGFTNFAKENLRVGRLIYLGTDPVEHEVLYSQGHPKIRALIDQHSDIVTYGENIGTERCPLPPLPRLRARTRQPVVLPWWEASVPPSGTLTTVCNWSGQLPIIFEGEPYYWSKDREFMKFIDLPTRVARPLELAMGLDWLPKDALELLTANGWRLTDAHRFTLDPWAYRDYVQSSAGEFTVAKDQNVRLKSGWFSERSACYLAAGRPVVTQDTGFGSVLPTGEGLFAFETMDEILAALDAIQSDYARQSRAARQIAEEYFRAETVLSKLFQDLNI